MKNKEKRGLLLSALLVLTLLLLPACGRRMSRYELRELGIEAMRAGDYEGAKQRFSEALDASDGQVSELQFDILKYRAECELRLKQYEEAKNTYSILEKLDEDEENQAVYQEVLNEMEGLSALTDALSLMDAGDYAGALDMLSPAADLNGGAAGRAAFFNRAVCMEYLQRFDEAEEAFSAYLEAYPDDAKAQKELDFLKTR